MDPYQSNTDGLLQLLSDYGTTSTSSDLLNLLSGWPGPSDSTQQVVQQPVAQSGGGTPPPAQPTNGYQQNPNYNPSGYQQQQTPPTALGTQGPGTQGGQGQGGNTPPQGQNGLDINYLQIAGILAVVVAIYFVTKKR